VEQRVSDESQELFADGRERWGRTGEKIERFADVRRAIDGGEHFELGRGDGPIAADSGRRDAEDGALFQSTRRALCFDHLARGANVRRDAQLFALEKRIRRFEKVEAA
jgi:hypothetical protein